MVSSSTSLLIMSSLNRTFYGIETKMHIDNTPPDSVLIVPFMELKPVRGTSNIYRSES